MIRPALSLLVAFTLLCGVAYPAFVTLAAQALLPWKANGSPVERDGRAVGSLLVGQAWDDPRYLWGRPSALARPYDARDSGGSNQGPLDPALHAAVRARVAVLRAAGPSDGAPVPVDLVTTSGSGLDPHVSPAAALWQAPRIARARGLPEDVVRALILRHVEPPALGLLGAPRVNVLLVNLALDGRRA